MKKSLFVIAFLLVLSCNSQQKKEHLSNSSDYINKIMVVLDSIPDMKVYFTPTGGEFHSRNLCSYITDDFEEYSFPYPITNTTIDTIEINTLQKSIFFRVSFLGGTSSIDFPLNTGRTYHIGFKDTIPYIKNDLTFQHINRYFQSLYHLVYENKINSIKRLDDIGPIAFIKGKKRFPSQEELNQVIPEILKKAQEEINWQETYLDSLYATQKIDKEAYIVYMDEIRLNKYIFNQNIKKNRFLKKFNNSYRKDWESALSVSAIVPDYYHNYNDFYLKYRHQNIDSLLYSDEKNTMMDISNALKSINAGKGFKKIIECQFLDGLYAEAPWKIIQKNTQEYLALYPNSELPNFLFTKYNVDTTSVNDVKLISKDGEKTTLPNVLAELHGHDIVLDIWASWCAPCIEKIKSTEKERQENEKKGTVYVFITYFDEKSEWLKRIKEIGLENKKHSYFTTNSQTSKWFNEMKITSIPTIIYYNEAGTIVKTTK